jgi:hypothetical protein
MSQEGAHFPNAGAVRLRPNWNAGLELGSGWSLRQVHLLRRQQCTPQPVDKPLDAGRHFGVL